MSINHNGKLVAETEPILTHQNRGFKYGDAVFETIKAVEGKVVFLENHYFRLMATMRVLRMEIPMDFTLEFFESEILKIILANDLQDARVRFSVYRNDGGLYTPKNNDIVYIIEATPLKNTFFEEYCIELFNDHYINSGLLSTLKTTNRIINVLASIYAKENGYNNCLLLNEKKNVVEAMNGNLFLIKDQKIITSPLADGCIKGIVRGKLLEYLKKEKEFECEEGSISPFDLHKADELFVTNAITGIQPVTSYRKTNYKTEISKYLRLEVMPNLQ